MRICTNKFGNSWTWSWWPLGLASKRQGWLEIVAAFHTNLSVERDDVILAIPEVNMVITRLYSLRHNLFQPSFKPALSLPPRWDLTEDGVGLGKNGTWENDFLKEVSMGKKGGESRFPSKVCAMTLLWNQEPWHSVEFTCKPCKLAQTFEALGSPRWFLWYSTDWSMFRVSVCLFLGSTIASLWLTTTYQFVINYVFCDGKPNHCLEYYILMLFRTFRTIYEAFSPDIKWGECHPKTTKRRVAVTAAAACLGCLDKGDFLRMMCPDGYRLPSMQGEVLGSGR